MKCRVEYNDGRPSEEHSSIQAAMMGLMAEYPNAIAVDAGGFERDTEDTDDCYDVRSGRAALVWESRDAAGDPGTGDDGSHAVAEIIIESDD